MNLGDQRFAIEIAESEETRIQARFSLAIMLRERRSLDRPSGMGSASVKRNSQEFHSVDQLFAVQRLEYRRGDRRFGGCEIRNRNLSILAGSARTTNSRKGISMNRGMLTIIPSIFVLCTVVLCMTLAARKVSGQSAHAQISAQVYNPYPPGILPSDLNPEQGAA